MYIAKLEEMGRQPQRKRKWFNRLKSLVGWKKQKIGNSVRRTQKGTKVKSRKTKYKTVNERLICKAGRFDINAEQGTTFILYANYQDSSGNAIDLASYTNGRMQVRRSNDSQS